MADLLIHSMREFKDLILGCLAEAQAKDIVEIGAEYGGMTSVLAGWLGERGGTLRSIDPSPKEEFLDWLAGTPSVCHIARTSLEALPGLQGADAWLIDGDHNWYTVYHELKLILENCALHGRPALVFLHDVGWPCGRRDTYYAPDRIPAEARHMHSFSDGVTLDRASLVPGGGFRGAGIFACAHHEGGPRNGVRTAVEDVLRQSAMDGRPLGWRFVPAVFGLGVVYDRAAPWAGAVERLLAPWHENALLATLELNRLANYLAVIEWQDRQAPAQT